MGNASHRPHSLTHEPDPSPVEGNPRLGHPPPSPQSFSIVVGAFPVFHAATRHLRPPPSLTAPEASSAAPGCHIPTVPAQHSVPADAPGDFSAALASSVTAPIAPDAIIVHLHSDASTAAHATAHAAYGCEDATGGARRHMSWTHDFIGLCAVLSTIAFSPAALTDIDLYAMNEIT